MCSATHIIALCPLQSVSRLLCVGVPANGLNHLCYQRTFLHLIFTGPCDHPDVHRPWWSSSDDCISDHESMSDQETTSGVKDFAAVFPPDYLSMLVEPPSRLKMRECWHSGQHGGLANKQGVYASKLLTCPHITIRFKLQAEPARCLFTYM